MPTWSNTRPRLLPDRRSNLSLVGKLIYSMNVSLDGFIEGPDGKFDWSVPDEELHRFHNERVGRLSAHLLGRRLYETMVFWETAEQDPAISDYAAEFARIWRRLPKVVFSSTLTEVEGNTRLATGSVEEEVNRLTSESEGDIAVGGPGLAAACAELDLIDEYEPFVLPIIVGGGRPFLPTLAAPLELALAETRTFGSRAIYTRYERLRPEG
jgi:dihydrofolate reductase